MAWPSVRMPFAATRARSSRRVSGPSSASAASMIRMARSAWAGETPSSPSRRRLFAACLGAVSASIHA